MLKEITVVLLILLLAWIYQISQPPPPNICGSPGGPAIIAPRIKLRDGRHLAYKEHGLSKDLAKHKIIFIYGFSSSRHDAVIATSLSQDVVEELGVYVVSFDKPGYGESDPDPNRTMKSLAMDVEQLADHLGLGSRFYVVGFSMGGQAVWGCLKYIPHRLAGATLLAPVINYWWPGFPAKLSQKAYYQQLAPDQWAVRVAHYTPWLTHWWYTQKLFPPSTVIARRPENFNPQDIQLQIAQKQQHKYFLTIFSLIITYNHIKRLNFKDLGLQGEPVKQGVYESLHRDMMIGFGSWEFDPMDLENPFPEGGGSVHIWQGDEDRLVPVILQRYISEKLPWIQYHELPGSGHLFPRADGMGEAILKVLLLDQK